MYHLSRWKCSERSTMQRKVPALEQRIAEIILRCSGKPPHRDGGRRSIGRMAIKASV
jgi:hypothetical protein